MMGILCIGVMDQILLLPTLSNVSRIEASGTRSSQLTAQMAIMENRKPGTIS